MLLSAVSDLSKKNNKKLLRVKRFLQAENECAVAAAASLANFCDRRIKYYDLQKIVTTDQKKYGLYTSEQASLLNKIGIKNVTIVTSDLRIVDYSWNKLSKKMLITKLLQTKSYYKNKQRTNFLYNETYIKICDLLKWLKSKNNNNNLIIDHDFASYIRKSINAGYPVGVSVNMTSLFKLKKWPYDKNSDIKGIFTEHAVVVRGYDKNNVYIVDSDHGFKKIAHLKKYINGYYKISWEKLLSNMVYGDLILIQK